jgi:methylmalonyl-CoA/ethylmalonyl-CoA epimerase
MGIAAEEITGFLFFHHVAVSVQLGDLEKQVAAYKAMGFKEIHREDVLGKDQVRKNGGREGLAHVALRVADIHKAFSALKAKGFQIIDAAPRPGSPGTTVFFVHPKTAEPPALGYLVEVVQEA